MGVWEMKIGLSQSIGPGYIGASTKHVSQNGKFRGHFFPFMFALRRFQCRSVRLTSTTATVQATSSATVAPVLEDAALEKRRHRPLKTRRPKISLEHPREWKRPLAYGVLPAYDEALKFIKADSEALKLEMQDLRAALTAAGQAPEPDPETIRQMKEKLAYLEIQSEINFPQVQWKCANGMGESASCGRFVLRALIVCLADMAKMVDRHIIEQRWRKEGALDLLVRRLILLLLTLASCSLRWNAFTKCTSYQT